MLIVVELSPNGENTGARGESVEVVALSAITHETVLTPQSAHDAVNYATSSIIYFVNMCFLVLPLELCILLICVLRDPNSWISYHSYYFSYK